MKIYFQTVTSSFLFAAITSGCVNTTRSTNKQSKTLGTWKLCCFRPALLFSALSPRCLWVTWVLSFPFQHDRYKQWQTSFLLGVIDLVLLRFLFYAFLLNEISAVCLNRCWQDLISCVIPKYTDVRSLVDNIGLVVTAQTQFYNGCFVTCQHTAWVTASCLSPRVNENGTVARLNTMTKAFSISYNFCTGHILLPCVL